MLYFGLFLSGLCFGALILYMLKQREIYKLNSDNLRLKLEKKQSETLLKQSQENKEELKNTFKALSKDVLQDSNKSFLDLAKETLTNFNNDAKNDLEKRQKGIENLLKPVNETLGKFDKQIREIEKDRQGSYTAIEKSLSNLHNETNFLLNALKAPKSKGQWGEMQLKRVIELAGMVDHVDFTEQEFLKTEEGRQYPDVVIKIPGGKQIVIDAKTPLESYMEAMNCEDSKKREDLLKNHSLIIRQHMKELGRKGYWEKLENTPEFVVMFLPDENLFSSALQFDPSLIEAGTQMNVVLATPTTLIALLKAVAYGWRQEALADNAKKISKLGEDLYKRLTVYSSHMNKIGKGLKSAVDNYNKSVGSLERNVFPAARRFKNLGIGSSKEKLESIELIDNQPANID